MPIEEQESCQGKEKATKIVRIIKIFFQELVKEDKISNKGKKYFQERGKGRVGRGEVESK